MPHVEQDFEENVVIVMSIALGSHGDWQGSYIDKWAKNSYIDMVADALK